MIKIHKNKYEALLFDFDGTLVLTEKIHYLNFKEVLKTIDIEIVSYDEFLKQYSGRGGQYIFEEETRKYSVHADIDVLVELKKKLFKKSVQDHGVELVSGAVEVLQNAHNAGFKIALVTGGFRQNLNIILESSDLPNLFDVVITNEDFTEPKPSPQCFLMAAEKLAVAPDSCLVFEDALNGIQAARQANMHCIALSTSNSRETLQSQFELLEVINNFSDIHVS